MRTGIICLNYKLAGAFRVVGRDFVYSKEEVMNQLSDTDFILLARFFCQEATEEEKIEIEMKRKKNSNFRFAFDQLLEMGSEFNHGNDKGGHQGQLAFERVTRRLKEDGFL